MTAARYALPVIFVAWLSALATALPARADVLQQQSFSQWKVMTNCTTAATKQFPDHTPESNAKREAAREQCLRDHKIPVPAAAPAPQPR